MAKVAERDDLWDLESDTDLTGVARLRIFSNHDQLTIDYFFSQRSEHSGSDQYKRSESGTSKTCFVL